MGTRSSFSDSVLPEFFGLLERSFCKPHSMLGNTQVHTGAIELATNQLK